MTFDEYRRIKEANEASVQPDSGYTKLCEGIEELILLYEGARDERDAALLQVRELKAALINTVEFVHLTCAHNEGGHADRKACPAPVCMQSSKALGDYTEKRVEPSRKCSGCECPHDFEVVKSHTADPDWPGRCTHCGKEQD